MKGICIDTRATTVLQEGNEYFLFEHGPNNFYVSRFDNVNSHCGSYQRNHFKLIENQQPFEHPGELLDDGSVIYFNENPDIEPYIEPPQRFIAKVARWRIGYNMGEEFIISQPGPNGYFNVYLKDKPHKGPIGSYITDFFEVIGPYDEPKRIMPITRTETPKIKEIEEPAPIPLVEVTTQEIEPKTRKIKRDKIKELEVAGQLSIFDFLGV